MAFSLLWLDNYISFSYKLTIGKKGEKERISVRKINALLKYSQYHLCLIGDTQLILAAIV